jgi:hypothetical protein
MLSDTDIANQALANLGSVPMIQNLDTDQSKEARVARQYFGNTRRSSLERYNWWFATVFQPLVLLEEFHHAEWRFVYQKPNDALRLSRIWNGSHKDTVQSKVEIVQGVFNNVPVILSDIPPHCYTKTVNGVSTTFTVGPILQYVQDFKNVVLMPDAYKSALAMEMSAFMAPSLPGIGSINLRKDNLVLASGLWQQALANDLNQSWIRPELKSFIENAGRGERMGTFGRREKYVDANYTWEPG